VHDSLEGYFLVGDKEFFLLDVEGFDDDLMGILFEFGFSDHLVEIHIKLKVLRSVVQFLVD
jgi:hypothetical protein